jgi:7-cyano-7-deazaguanine synthase
VKTLVVCSGGMDSVTLAHLVKRDPGRELTRLVSFDYGQRHRRELEFAGLAARSLGVGHDLIDIAAIGRRLTGSALTDDVEVPDGHYAEESMRLTVVPNRNAIMLAIAFGIAAAKGDQAVAAAMHAGDHFIYPDCRPAFVEAFGAMQKTALDGFWDIEFHAPFVAFGKAEIARIGAGLGVPFENTWSCYRGGARHCGRCGTCVERQEALHLANVIDPTEYEDPDYWRSVAEPGGVTS